MIRLKYMTYKCYINNIAFVLNDNAVLFRDQNPCRLNASILTESPKVFGAKTEVRKINVQIMFQVDHKIQAKIHPIQGQDGQLTS